MIFGTEAPSIILSDNSEIILDYSTLDSKLLIPSILEHKSVLTGKRHFIRNGDISEFKVTIYLYRYSNYKQAYNSLKSIENELVRFKPHRDKPDVIKNYLAEDAYYYITDINEYYLMNLDKYDMVNISFKSNEYVSLFDNLEIMGYGYGYGEYYGDQL